MTSVKVLESGRNLTSNPEKFGMAKISPVNISY